MNWKLVKGVVASCVALLIAGCGAGGGSGAGGVVTPTGTVSLSTSANSVNTDNSDLATITAMVVDTNNAAVSGATVTFSTTSGVLSAATGTTGANGQATVTIASGTANATNRTATITATVGNSTATVPVQISGSTLTLTPSSLTVTSGDALTATATARDASLTGKNNQPIRFSIDAASTGAATLSATTLNTGVSGTTAAVTITTTAPGNVILVAEWLDGSGNVTQTSTQTIVANIPVGTPFAVTAPAVSPTSLALGGIQAVTVSVPANINGTAITNVRYSASSGQWTNASATITVVPAAGFATATYTAPANSGTVNIQIDALSAGNAVLASLNRIFAVSAQPGSEASLTLQTSSATITPSAGGTAATATITATVKDALNSTVANSPVLFELLNTTGSGETLSPTVSYTDAAGTARAIFTSGSASTTVTIRASIVGGPAQPATANCLAGSVCNTITQTVAINAVSLTLGFSSTIESVDNNTNYLWPASVLVVNNNGSPVAGANVSLTLFPSTYSEGTMGSAKGCPITLTTLPTTAEDSLLTGTVDYRNGILNAGEDADGSGTLTPAQAVAGSVPANVVTDSNGVAIFDIRYPKTSGGFIAYELTARTTVSGTQGSTVWVDELPISAADGNADPCPIAGTRNF